MNATVETIECRELTAYGAPLSAGRRAMPQPVGREALLRVRHCGVCHSDLHIQDGYFALGGDKRLDIGSGRPMPFTLGHEVEGEVAALGPEAEGASVGDRAVVYPWIGCGDCAVCEGGEEQLCARPRNIGVNLHGGYADYCLVPDAKYLFGYGDTPPALAATYACSGITAFGALKKLMRPASPGPIMPGPIIPEPIMIVGLGGVGMAGLAFARALFPEAPLAADIDPAKRRAALDAGAQAAFDSADPAAAKAVRKATGGGVAGVVDFVGSEASFGFADAVTRKGGAHRRGRADGRAHVDAAAVVPVARADGIGLAGGVAGATSPRRWRWSAPARWTPRRCRSGLWRRRTGFWTRCAPAGSSAAPCSRRTRPPDGERRGRQAASGARLR